MVASNDLGDRLAGVSIKRVRAVSIGLRRTEERVVDAVAIKTLAKGAVEVRIKVPCKDAAGDGLVISPSGIPRIAANNDLKKFSNVRWRMV